MGYGSAGLAGCRGLQRRQDRVFLAHQDLGHGTGTTAGVGVPPRLERQRYGFVLRQSASFRPQPHPKRLRWDDLAKIAYDDLVGEIVGAVSEGAADGIGVACAANDLYENRAGADRLLHATTTERTTSVYSGVSTAAVPGPIKITKYTYPLQT